MKGPHGSFWSAMDQYAGLESRMIVIKVFKGMVCAVVKSQSEISHI